MIADETIVMIGEQTNNARYENKYINKINCVNVSKYTNIAIIILLLN